MRKSPGGEAFATRRREGTHPLSAGANDRLLCCLRPTLAAADGARENDGRRRRHFAEIGHSPGPGPDGRIGKIVADGADPLARVPADRLARAQVGCVSNSASCREKSRFAAESRVLKPHRVRDVHYARTPPAHAE
jgi:hypothetical protein